MKSTAQEEPNITQDSSYDQKTDHVHQMKRIKILILSIVVLLPLCFLSHIEFPHTNENGPEIIQSDDKHWLENYEPRYGLGSVQYNWWIPYYNGHPEAGSKVNHTEWIVESLQNNSVVILIHGTTCHGCEETKNNMHNCLEIYGSNFTYFELNADGEDNRTEEVFNTYDPTAGQNLIPLTVIITLIIDDNNETQIAWHSAEGERSEDWIESYMQDSIYYHRQYLETWRI